MLTDSSEQKQKIWKPTRKESNPDRATLFAWRTGSSDKLPFVVGAQGLEPWTLTCPAGKKDVLVFDDEQRGLGVRVTAAGSKTYLAQYTLGGIKRRVPLGSCSAISLAAARDAVRAILGDVAKGRDPAADRKEAAREAQRKAAADALTLEALLRQWEALRLADKRERYAAEAVRAFRYAFAKHMNAPAGALDRSTIVRVLDGLTKEGKAAMASRTAAYGRACYQWAMKRSSLTVNPFQDLPLEPVAKRERVLTDDELHSIWQATTGPGPFNAIVRMLMLTGQRREEVAGMAWDELAGDLSIWTVPASRAKNGAAHLAPLSSLAIVRGVRRITGTDVVFAGLHGPFNGFSKAKAALKNEEAMTPSWSGPLGADEDQAADLTAGRGLRSSNCCGLR